MNVDASFINLQTKAGIAGVFRTSQGQWIVGIQAACYALDPYHAELLAVRNALQEASCRNLPYIILRTDCQRAVQTINMELDFDDLHSDIVIQCRELRLYFQEMKIVFVKREDNQVADKLAKECINILEDFNVIRNLPHPPNYCKNLLATDCNRLFAINS